jgi:two-component system, NarL family, sensor histidine kinase DesK
MADPRAAGIRMAAPSPARLGWAGMAADADQASIAAARWATAHRAWTQGRRRLVIPAVLLAYLIYAAEAVGRYSHGVGVVVGDAILAAFAVCWLAVMAPVVQGAFVVAVPVSRPTSRPRWVFYWVLCCILGVLFLAELPFARAEAFLLCLYITTLTVPVLGRRSAPIVAALTVAALVVPAMIPSWHDSISTAFDDSIPIGIPVTALATFAAVRVQRVIIELAEARAGLAALAAENERLRIARDLHDLLGRSLTSITVKASLARRLGPADPAQALTEIADVEDLARRSLADVRTAVNRYRDVTLAGELAAGKDLLRAAGISADLPGSVDVIDPAYQELFAWAVREGLTNIVRHSRAGSCAVRLTACSIEISDNGAGTAAPEGNGLSGLRERVTAAGGVIEAGPQRASGWRLRVWLPPSQDAS